ncbi:MAG: HRDC domain-containing protein [Chitinophagaceae bacterium]|nr:HRDC domain-containing protein [Chitinophagaceae bacterium]
MMQLKIISVPVIGGEMETETINVWIKQSKVISLDKQLVCVGSMYYWSFCFQFLEGAIPGRNLKYPEKVDYRMVLEEDVFKRFAALREIRKEIAKAEAIPAFAIFTDAELAEMAKVEILTSEVMQNIQGIGEKKIEKYGSKFLNR